MTFTVDTYLRQQRELSKEVHRVKVTVEVSILNLHRVSGEVYILVYVHNKFTMNNIKFEEIIIQRSK